MSKKSPTDLRELLDGRPTEAGDFRGAAEYLLKVSPGCECEHAAPVTGGHGRVEPAEKMSMYIGAPRHSRKRSDDQKVLKQREGFPFNAAIFDAFCEGGLSLIREDKASDEEVKHQVSSITNGLRNDDPKGGIFSILQFDAAVIFGSCDAESNSRNFCIYDTPILNEAPSPDVFSHADLFVGGPKDSSAKALRTKRRVQIIAALKEAFIELTVASYRDYILKPWEASPSLPPPTK